MTRLERLLDTIADRPAGEKVNVPALIRAFTPTQAQIIEAIERLVGTGQLDRDTLRRPAVPVLRHGWRHDDVPAVIIIAEIETFLARSGLSKSRFGRECLHDPKFVSRLEGEAISVRAPTAKKIRAFIAEYPASGANSETCAETQTEQKCLTDKTPADASAKAEPTEPPATRVAAHGGGAARCEAPPPDPDPQFYLQFFRPHWEKLGIVAQRWGGGSAFKLRRFAQRLRDLGLLEFQQLDPQCLWRLASSNMKGASGTAREAPSATESTVAEADNLGSAEPSAIRTEGRAPAEEPAPTIVPLARARPPAAKVDIKVNAPRRHRISSEQHGARIAAGIRRAIRKKAQEAVDAGIAPHKAGNQQVRGAMLEIEEHRAEQDRLTDPIEQAKTVIRIGGWSCFSAVISGGPPDHYYIGNRVVDEAYLLAFAERLRATRARRAG